MMKRIISLCLCLLMVLPVFASCAKEEDETDKGAYISMYLTDPVYNFDPAYAFGNEAALKVVSLMFDTLFVLNENGKVKKSLAKDYQILEDEEKNEYKMIITLNETAWSDGVAVSANDVVWAWRRLLDNSASFGAASLLYDIKNAREAKENNGATISDVCLFALNETQLEIQFVGKIDYDRFLLNLTSPALAPLREDIAAQAKNPMDWAKKPSIFVASGPFKLKNISYGADAGLVLERNMYYYRDYTVDAQDKSVTPYRLVVDYTKSDEEILNGYRSGTIFYIGDIPLSLRDDLREEATVTDALSTHTYILNQNAIVRYYTNDEDLKKLESNGVVYDDTLVEGVDGEKIFQNANVRQALSLVIDRSKIANAIVFAEAATALVPTGVFNVNSKKEMFREKGGNILNTIAKVSEAQELLKEFDTSKYMIVLSVPAYDEIHVKIAEMVKEAWEVLGFHVALNKIDVIENPEGDIDNTTDSRIDGIKDDIFAESFAKKQFEVAAIDYVAYNATAMSVLAPFATHYNGSPVDINGTIEAHMTGYDSGAYNEKIDSAYKAESDAARVSLLHEAEKILMEDLPIIPIVFNKNATVISKELSKYKVTYYGTPIFTKVKLKDYQNYLPSEN